MKDWKRTGERIFLRTFWGFVHSAGESWLAMAARRVRQTIGYIRNEEGEVSWGRHCEPGSLSSLERGDTKWGAGDKERKCGKFGCVIASRGEIHAENVVIASGLRRSEFKGEVLGGAGWSRRVGRVVGLGVWVSFWVSEYEPNDM